MTPQPPTTFALAKGVVAACTSAATGNLAHRRPHVPGELHASRRALAAALGVEVADLHHMRQVHGGAVGVIGPATTRGAELAGVDALATDLPGRALVVQAADCVPVLLAADDGPIGVAHAGRNGIVADVIGALVATLGRLGAPATSLHAAIGPAIGPCCYEVPSALAHEVASVMDDPDDFIGTTTWGTVSLDLPAMAMAQLGRAGVEDVQATPACTHCDGERWFSHRRDARAGRQVAAVVRGVRAAAVAA